MFKVVSISFSLFDYKKKLRHVEQNKQTAEVA